MKHESSLSCPQERATGPYPEPVEFSALLPTLFRSDPNTGEPG
jgi:hypothetical protein